MSRQLGGQDLDDDDELHGFEAEGVQAFTQLAGAVQNLRVSLGTFEQGLGTKVASAERVASHAQTAAHNAMQAAQHAAATTRAEARSWIAFTSCIVTCGVVAAGIVGYVLGERAGQATGQAAGYREARSEAAAASWANTPAGRTALALDQIGSLSMLAQCTNQGWTAEIIKGRRVCFIRPTKDGSIYGWNLP